MTTLIDFTQSPGELFQDGRMRKMAEFMATRNCESQVVAAVSADIGDTGTKLMFINGQPIVKIKDSSVDLSADVTEAPGTAWATATSYTAGDPRVSNGARYVCHTTHTSAATTEPGVGENWQAYWEQRNHMAVNASGTEVAASKDMWFMITSDKVGTLGLWEAGDQADTGEAICKVPQYDPKTYCPIGFLLIPNSSASSAFVVGTTSLGSVTPVFVNVTGPVFPHADHFDD